MLLLEKIEKVLIELLKVVSEKIKYPPKTDDDAIGNCNLLLVIK